MTLGDKLLQLRKNNDMSQEELANELGVSRQAISRWEMGNVYPDSTNLLKIAQMFKVTTDYLLDNKYSVKDDVKNGDYNKDSKEEEHMKQKADQKRINSYIKYGNLIECVLLFIVCGVMKLNFEIFITAGVLVLFGFMMSAIFRYVIITESYDIISGVDTKKHQYDEVELKKFLLNLEFTFVTNTLIISNVIMGLGLISTLPENKGEIAVFGSIMIYAIATIAVVIKLSRRIKPIQTE